MLSGDCLLGPGLLAVLTGHKIRQHAESMCAILVNPSKMVDETLETLFLPNLPTSCWQGSVGELGPQLVMPAEGGCPVHLSLNMVESSQKLDTFEQHLWNISEQSTPENACATILLLRSMSPMAKEQLIASGWFKTPLHHWMQLAWVLDILAKVGKCRGFSELDLQHFRSIKKVLVRTNEDADWTAERLNRQKHRTFCLPYHGSRSVDMFNNRLRKAIWDLTKKLHDRLGARRVVHTAHEFWQRRTQLIASGSSHIRGVAGSLEQDARFGAMDRANKKTIVEFLDDDFLWWVLTELTPRNLAHGSTKYEPGGKQRALFASSDIEYFVGSYASEDHEKHLNFDGLMGKQGVLDMVSWLRQSLNIVDAGAWGCADFSDFNAEHRLDDLKFIELCFAAHSFAHAEEDSWFDKALAHCWVAKSYDNSWAIDGDGDLSRVFQGLFSGSRDTARNNTLMHAAYLAVNKSAFDDLNIDCSVKGKWICGDDEDIYFTKNSDAGDWISMYLLSGHDINFSKQLIGKKRHEFLKVTYSAEGWFNRPLGSILATLATGNWYVPSATWQLSAVESVTANWADAVGRGLSWRTGQMMAASYLDIMMRVRITAKEAAEVDIEQAPCKEACLHVLEHGGFGTYLIEWWQHTKVSEVSRAFWAGSNAGDKAINMESVKMRAGNAWQSRGVDALMRVYEDQLQLIHAESIEQIKEGLVKQSYAKTFHRYRQAEERRLAMFLPKRTTNSADRQFTSIVMIQRPSSRLVAQMLDCVGGQEPSTSWEETYSRVDLLPTIGMILGPIEALRSLKKPKLWSKWSEPVVKADKQLIVDLSLPSMLRSTLARLNADRRLIHKAASDRQIELILAMNGAGKSLWCMSHPDTVDVDAAILRMNIPHVSKHDDLRYKRWVAQAVVRDAKSRGANTIIGQRYMCDIAEALHPSEIRSAKVVMPQPDIIMTRLLNRGWTDERIKTRFAQNAREEHNYSRKLVGVVALTKHERIPM